MAVNRSFSFPTQDPTGATGPAGPPGPPGTPYETVTSDTNALKGQAARRTTAGHVELAIDNIAGSGVGVFAVYRADVLAGGTVDVIKTGGPPLTVAGLTTGDVYRDMLGNLVPMSTLLVGATAADRTNRMGYYNGTSLDVTVGEEQGVL